MRLSLLRCALFLLCFLPCVAQAQDDSWLGLGDDAVVETPKKSDTKSNDATKKSTKVANTDASKDVDIGILALTNPSTTAKKNATQTSNAKSKSGANSAKNAEIKSDVETGLVLQLLDSDLPSAKKNTTAAKNVETIKEIDEATSTVDVNNNAVAANKTGNVSNQDLLRGAKKSDPGAAAITTDTNVLSSDIDPYSTLDATSPYQQPEADPFAPRVVVVESGKLDPKKPDSPIKGHGLGLAMSFVGIPGYIFRTWYDENGYFWDGVVDMGYSLDYTLRFHLPMELRFSLSWTNLRTGDAYWLEKDASPELADYVHNTMSTVALEAAIYHVVPAAKHVDFYYGGGLWGGVVLGDIEEYAISGSCATENYTDLSVCSHSPAGQKMKSLPPMLGSVIVTLGFKFTFLDHLVLRAEGGFKGYFYGQVGIGVEFDHDMK